MPNFSGLWTANQQFQAVGGSTWPSFPGAPTIGTATATSGTAASVTFTAPSSAGFPATITGYIVTSSPGGLTGTGASSPISVTGLTAGTTYTFTVRAINASGTGASSAASNSITPADYIEEVFSTYLYTGNGSTQTITNGIDLSGKGGLVWIKQRTGANGHNLYDTARGATQKLATNETNESNTVASGLTSFSASGFSLGSFAETNLNTSSFVSWTFREQPKFFDIVTWTGNGAAARAISHNLGSTPGCMIVKRTDAAGDWRVYHRGCSTDNGLVLNDTAAQTTSAIYWFGNEVNVIPPTSTQFTVNAGFTNTNGGTYVAYLFAHDAGGFGTSGTDNIISCGSFTTDGSGVATVNLGYEPQWVMYKPTNLVNSWNIIDTMRGYPNGGNDPFLRANSSDAEYTVADLGHPTATGFYAQVDGNATCIYIAIRRGPMKVPTLGTSVFSPVAHSASSTYVVDAGFPTDMAIAHYRTPSSGNSGATSDRLRGSNVILQTFSTNADATIAGWADYNSSMSGLRVSGGASWAGGNSYIFWNFRRAPGFFDVVAYTGTGVDLTVNHNLGVVPEWVIIKNRSRAGTNWSGAYFANASEYYDVRINQDIGRSLITMGPLGPTLISNSATTFGVYGGSTLVNYSGDTYVAYLFATLAGVSKVGSYAGTGTTQTINCDFTAGARFVLIKRTDSTGDWYVWDTTRGIIAGNDPYLLLNSSAIEVTNTDYIDAAATGFELSSTAPAALNASGGTYIFLAIA